MKNLAATICLTIAVLLGGAGVSSSADIQKGIDAYNSGDLVTTELEWKPLAEQGDAHAQYLMGLLYKEGLEDYSNALPWIRLSAAQLHPGAQFFLGVMHEFGQGVLQDYKAAVHWYGLAAQQGHNVAHLRLGNAYEQGFGVKQDNVHAHMWYNIAAIAGSEQAGRARDRIARKFLTLPEIAEAQKLARECVEQLYYGC